MENRLTEISNVSKVSHNGAFKQNESLPDFVISQYIRIQAKVNPNHLGESINDGGALFVKQTFIACLEDEAVGYLPEDELPMLMELRKSLDYRIGKVKLRIQNKERRSAHQVKHPTNTGNALKHNHKSLIK
jgi:hypothetical protein